MRTIYLSSDTAPISINPNEHHYTIGESLPKPHIYKRFGKWRYCTHYGKPPQSSSINQQIVCYRGTAKIAQDWLKKGKLICIEGKIVYRQWQDEHQVTHYKTEIIAEQIQMLGKKDD
ncbi:single-stranded DNA-binding protein [Wielerella bovis]|uniref:single-stranded DNA-binding protein n=1 Tax=Wielerella bovis TaxID=2917790 RepID=UPI002019F245|nr:single-stranded DNA-binding protein [Wielerella bovis]ULJ67887.1 single-stranded DNA-binding protein [Wielerella bovis]